MSIQRSIYKVLGLTSVLASSVFVLQGCGASKTTIGQPPQAKQEKPNLPQQNLTNSRVLVANSFYLETELEKLEAPSTGVAPKNLVGSIAAIAEVRGEDLTKGSSLTGAVTNENLVYTGLESDTLLASLRDQDFKTAEPKRSLNFQTASQIASAKLDVDLATNTVSVVIQSSISDFVSSVTYVGIYNPFGESLLHPVNAWVPQSFEAADKLSATLKCLNVDGSCQTSLFTVSPDQHGSVDVVFRKGAADLKAILPKQEGAPLNDNSFVNVILNTFVANQKDSDQVPRVGQFQNKLVVSKLESFEVVNGRSGFTATLATEKNDVLSVSGPLVNSMNSTPLKISSKIQLRSFSNCSSQVGAGPCSFPMSDVASANLIRNEVGNLGIELTLNRFKNVGSQRQAYKALLFFKKQLN